MWHSMLVPVLQGILIYIGLSECPELCQKLMENITNPCIHMILLNIKMSLIDFIRSCDSLLSVISFTI